MTDPRCSCPSPTDLLVAALSDTDPELCELHQADEIAHRKVQAEVAHREAARVRLEEAIDEMTPPDELEARRQAKALAEMDPLTRSLTLITRRGSDLPLGGHPSQYPALAGFTDGDDAA